MKKIRRAVRIGNTNDPEVANWIAIAYLVRKGISYKEIMEMPVTDMQILLTIFEEMDKEEMRELRRNART